MGVIGKFVCKKWDKLGILLGLGILRIVYAFFLLATPELLRQSASAIETGDMGLLKVILIEAVIVTLVLIGSNYWYQVACQKYKNHIEGMLQKRVIGKQYHLEKKSRSQYTIGELMTYAMQNVSQAVQNTTETIFAYTEGLVIIVSGAVYMLLLDWKMGSIAILYDILFRVATKFYDRKIQRVTEKGIEISERNTSFLMDFLKNVMVIRIFKRQKYFLDELKKREEEDRQNGNRQFAFYQSYGELQWACKAMVNIFLLFGFGSWLVSKGEMEFSVIIALTMATDYFAKGIIKWTEGNVYKNKAMPNIIILEEFLNRKGEEVCFDEKENKENDPIKGKPLMEMRDVAFSYGDQKLFEHVNLTIRKGEWIQIVGANGEGKSTLLQILTGVYKPQYGQVFFQGREIKGRERIRLREMCVYIPQIPQIVNDTIWNNLALDDEVDMERAKKIVEEIGLEKVTEEKPKRYSQGEKQRLCIGRAFYYWKEQPMMIGDEIFSCIDGQNRIRMAKLIQKYGKGKTMLFVCHDKMEIPFDRTIRVEHGSVLEEGREK